jgi:hypothetical protein
MGTGGPKQKKQYSPEVEQQVIDEIQAENKNRKELSKKDKALSEEARKKAQEIAPHLQQLGLTDTRAAQKKIVGKDMNIKQLQERMDRAKEQGNEMDAQVAEYRRDFETARRDAIHKEVTSMTKHGLSAANSKQPPPVPDRSTKPPVLPKPSRKNKSQDVSDL